MASDESWAEAARASRAALAELGYAIGPKCLPGEAEPCGASFAQHAMAHYAAIKAVADHQLMHLGGHFVSAHAEIYWDHRAQLDADCRGNHGGAS